MRNDRPVTVLAVVAVTLGSFAAFAQDRPTPGAPQPGAAEKGAAGVTPIYNEAADARVDIAAAVARAARDHRRVLVVWGGNWCPWCRRLHEALTTDPTLSRVVQGEYETVRVDVGRVDRNLDLARELGANLKMFGLPFLTVLDDNGKPVINRETGTLEADDEKNPRYDTERIARFLKANQAPALKADDLLAAGLERARSDGRKVFVHFGAPWCGWCRRLDEWLARPDVSAIVAKDLVAVKIDVDRNPGGAAMLAEYRGGEKGGIPWHVILDPGAEGGPAVVITSDAPGSGNIGFPAEPAEVDHFIAMMRKAAVKMTPADVEALGATLRERPPAAENGGGQR
jgi:thiol:disulfide interchange protein